MGNFWLNSSEEENKRGCCATGSAPFEKQQNNRRETRFSKSLDNEPNKNNKIRTEFHPPKDIHTNNILLEGFVRSIESKLYGIIPASIIQLLHRYYDSWMKLKPALKMALVHPYPIYYFSSIKQRGYIIITPHCQDSKTIVEYDTKQNCWNVLTDYPQHFDCECHSIVLDPINEILYFCFGYSQIFGWFDLKIKKWTLKCSKNNRFGDPLKYGIHMADYGDPCYITNPSLCFLSDLNEIHGIVHLKNFSAKDKHIKFNKITNKFELIANNWLLTKNPNLIYIKKEKMLLALGSQLEYSPKNIYFCKITINTPNDYVWNKFPCCLPYKSEIKCQIIFGTLLIGYFADEKELWCLDLDLDKEYIKCKWIKCLNVTLDVYHIVITKNEFVHFIGTFSGIHSKVHLSQILPTSIYHKYYYAK